MSAASRKPERSQRLKAFLVDEALAAGFDIAQDRRSRARSPRSLPPDSTPTSPTAATARCTGWPRHKGAAQRSPRLWPEVRSILMVGLNYGPDQDPLRLLQRPDRAAISVYAGNRDYHDVIKGRLKGIAGRFAARAGCDVKVFVDTAPVMEKPLAEKAGLGWQGKHSNLVSREFGSWLFLGSIFTDRAAAARRARSRPLRQLPRLSRHLPDRCLSGALPARCKALHLLPDDRAQGANTAGAAALASAIASMAATTASPYAPGTNSRALRTRPSWSCATIWRRRGWPT